jgi:hypothetical protein
MQLRINIGDLKTPADILRLTSVISELADTLDVSVVDSSPNGVMAARQGKKVLYNNSGTWELWMNVDGNTIWKQIQFVA